MNREYEDKDQQQLFGLPQNEYEKAEKQEKSYHSNLSAVRKEELDSASVKGAKVEKEFSRPNIGAKSYGLNTPPELESLVNSAFN